jgi:hypothetical protein
VTTRRNGQLEFALNASQATFSATEAEAYFFKKVSRGVPYLYFLFSLKKNKRMYKEDIYTRGKRGRKNTRHPGPKNKRGKYHV